MSLINAEADQLTDLGDMQVQRKLNAELNEYVSAHFNLGSIPRDPLQEIGNRLNVISEFFGDAKLLLKELSEATRIIPNHDLKSISIVARKRMSADRIIPKLDELKIELKQVKEIEVSLPTRIENLKQLLNPLDWADNSPKNLHSELLICAWALGIELPEDKVERENIYEFVNFRGRILDEVKKNLKQKEKDVYDLIRAHDLCGKTLAVIMDCTKQGDLIKASEHLKTIKNTFADLPYDKAREAVIQLQVSCGKLINFCERIPIECERIIKDFALANAKDQISDLSNTFDDYKKVVSNYPNSEFEKKCEPYLEKARVAFAKSEIRLSERKRSRKFKLRAISVVLVAIGLVIADQYKAYIASQYKANQLKEAERERLAAYESPFSAAESGNIKAFKLRIAEGANLNVKDEWERTPLHNAARQGHKEIVELLILQGLDINAKTKGGMTPLHLAAEFGRKPVVELLVKHGAEVNVIGKFSETPLESVKFQYPDIADFLRDRGAKTSAELKASQK
ncbi:MAG: ankyrin repeat domain-containing protein [Akkermansiaceae bacterium]|nr:ankyrin repeat domain-containing protein [Akkermansiaceae bacterium]